MNFQNISEVFINSHMFENLLSEKLRKLFDKISISMTDASDNKVR